MTQEVHLGPVIEKLRKGVCRRVTTGRPAVVVDIEETERFMASAADILSLVVRASSTPDLSPALRTMLQQRHDLLREDARTDAANNYRYTTLEEHDASVAEADEIGRLLSARSSAPEDREGEPVGVVYSLKADLNTAELPDGTLLYTHPAHPSADHAELTRLAEAATPGRWTCKEGSTSYPECDDRDFWSVVLSPAGREIVQLNERGYHREDDRVDYDFDAAFIAAANPATVKNLLSEIAALRGEVERLASINVDHCSAVNTYVISNARLDDRLTQAERQRDELRKALEPFATYPLAVKMDGTVAPDEYQLTGRHDKEGNFRTVTNGDFQRARQALANQGADQ